MTSTTSTTITTFMGLTTHVSASLASSRFRNQSLVLICGFSSLCHRTPKVSKYEMPLHVDCKILTTLSNDGLQDARSLVTINAF